MKRFLICLIVLMASALVRAQAVLILDDDPGGDADSAVTPSIAYKLADRGEISIIGIMADGWSPCGAPVERALSGYYGYGTLPIGGNQAALGSSCNAWSQAVVTQFDAGDTQTNYPNCITEYQTLLSAQANASVTVVLTGVAQCLVGAVKANAALFKAKVAELVIMGGDYPNSSGVPGGAESNFASDPADNNWLFTNWTTQNGYAPIYLVGWTMGNGVLVGPPSYALTTVNPSTLAFSTYGCNPVSNPSYCQRPAWDAFAVLFAARGWTYNGATAFTDSGGGTNTVNASTGANSWSSTINSGHHYLSLAQSALFYAQQMDGYATSLGLAAMPPIVTGKNAAMN